jgi:pilus assembly protein CpaB
MNWKRALLGLFFSAVIGLGAALYVYTQFQKVAAAKSMPTSQVVVAAMPIPVGARLKASDLRLVTWPARQPLPGMFTRIEDCTDRALLTPVVANEPMLEGKLAPKEAGAGLAATIPDGMRAVSVSVNDVIGVAGFVVPGTMVDVLVTGSGGGSTSSVTRTILENVRVMAAGQTIEQDREGKPQTVPVITLLVTPEDANTLTMASTRGRIQLALRNTLDSKKVDPADVHQASLFGEAPTPAPAVKVSGKARMVVPPPPPSTFTVEIIRGDKKELAHFPNQ